MTSCLDKDLLNEILLVAEYTFSTNTETKHKIDNANISIFVDLDEVVQVTLRSLTNALNRESTHDNQYMEIFINEQVKGLQRILNIISSTTRIITLLFNQCGPTESFVTHTNGKFESIYFAIRLIYMIITQR